MLQWIILYIYHFASVQMHKFPEVGLLGERIIYICNFDRYFQIVFFFQGYINLHFSYKWRILAIATNPHQ